MSKKSIINTSNFVILLSLLIGANIIISIFLDMEKMRVPRVITTLILYVWFMCLKLEKKTLSTIAFSLLLVADISLFGYENKWLCFLRFITFIIINMLLSMHMFKRKYFAKIKLIPTVMVLVLFASCIFLTIYASEFIDFSVFGPVHEFLYYLYALTILVLILLTVIHSFYDYSKKIDIFLAAVISFLVSDLLLIIGYYADFYVAIQIERIFHIAAIGLIIYYVVLYNRDLKKVDSSL